MSENLNYPTIAPELLSLFQIPEFGAPPFPWAGLEKELKAAFKQEELTLSHLEKGWMPKESFGAKISKMTLPIFVTPLEAPLFWTMSEADFNILVELFFFSDERASYFLEKPLKEGLYQFLGLEVLKMIGKAQFSDLFTLHIGKKPPSFKEEPFYEIDLTLKTPQKHVNGHLLIPSSFRALWKKHFALFPSFSLTKEMKEKMTVDVGLEVGYTQLDIEELKKARPGDCLLLDHVSYDLDEKEGWVRLTVNNVSLWRGKLKKEGIKILEFPRIEEGKMMENMENFEMNEQKPEETSVSKSIEETASLATLPLQVVIEAGRLKMTLEELSRISAGSLLELPVAIEEGVDLVVNGRPIGKGELVKIGEMVGVRITKI